MGAYEPANPPPAPALARGVYEGVYVDGFEVSAFIACGSKERWWTKGNLGEVTQYEKQHPDNATPAGWSAARLFVRLDATPSATGNFGHLGSYPRELQVHEVIEVRDYRDGDCDEHADA